MTARFANHSGPLSTILTDRKRAIGRDLNDPSRSVAVRHPVKFHLMELLDGSVGSPGFRQGIWMNRKAG